jgi:O-antigen ligase
LTVFKRIEFGIFFIIPFIPHQNILDRLVQFPLGKDINDIIFIAMLIKWVIDKRKADEKLFVKTPLNLPILIFFIWTFLEIYWGAHYFGAPMPFKLTDPRIIYWKNLIRIPLFYLIIVNNIKKTNQMKLIILLMILAILLLDRSFYSIARWRDLSHYNDNERIEGVLYALGGNELAVFLACYVIVLVALFSYNRNLWIKLFLSGPIALSYWCITFLFSRSGYLAAVAGWMVVGLFKNRVIAVFIVALALFWQTLLPNAVRERIEMTKTKQGYDASAQSRFVMWETGQEMIMSNPVLGSGIGAAQFLNTTAKGITSRTWKSFHNSYIQQTVETGFVGLGIYLWIFFVMIKVGWLLYRFGENEFHKGLGLGSMACVVASMAGNIAGSYWNYLQMVGYMYTLAALGMRCIINIQEGTETPISNDDGANLQNEKSLINSDSQNEYAKYFAEKYSI